MSFLNYGESCFPPPAPGEFHGAVDGVLFDKMLAEDHGLLRVGEYLKGFAESYPNAEFLYDGEQLSRQPLDDQGQVGIIGRLVTRYEELGMDVRATYHMPSWLRHGRIGYLLFDISTLREVKLCAYVDRIESGRDS